MIPAETQYETHDGELLAIVEAFKLGGTISKVVSMKSLYL